VTRAAALSPAATAVVVILEEAIPEAETPAGAETLAVVTAAAEVAAVETPAVVALAAAVAVTTNCTATP
jgi:hypothetical protein